MRIIIAQIRHYPAAGRTVSFILGYDSKLGMARAACPLHSDNQHVSDILQISNRLVNCRSSENRLGVFFEGLGSRFYLGCLFARSAALVYKLVVNKHPYLKNLIVVGSFFAQNFINRRKTVLILN